MTEWRLAQLSRQYTVKQIVGPEVPNGSPHWAMLKNNVLLAWGTKRSLTIHATTTVLSILLSGLSNFVPCSLWSLWSLEIKESAVSSRITLLTILSRTHNDQSEHSVLKPYAYVSCTVAPAGTRRSGPAIRVACRSLHLLCWHNYFATIRLLHVSNNSNYTTSIK